MLYQGIIGGGSSPVEPVDLSPVLLWTNSNPGAEFAAQTVSLDLTEYAGVIVEFNHATNIAVVSSRVYIKKTDIVETGFGAGFVSDRACSRNLTVNNRGVIFADTYYATVTKNDVLIPAKIYGVKEYVVEPETGERVTIEEVSYFKIIPFTSSNGSQTVQLDKDFDFITVIMPNTTSSIGMISARSKTRQWAGTTGLGQSAEYGFTAFNGTSFTFRWDASYSVNFIAVKFKNSISDEELLNHIKNIPILNSFINTERFK